jgi:hypothetical protein
MNTLLDSLNLGEEMVMRGLESDPVAVDQQRSDAGVSILLVAEIDGGRVLEINGEITLGVEQQVLALSAAGVPVSLVHPRFSGQVLITGVKFDFVLTEYVNPTPSALREGSVFLIEV